MTRLETHAGYTRLLNQGQRDGIRQMTYSALAHMNLFYLLVHVLNATYIDNYWGYTTPPAHGDRRLSPHPHARGNPSDIT